MSQIITYWLITISLLGTAVGAFAVFRVLRRNGWPECQVCGAIVRPDQKTCSECRTLDGED